MNTRFNKRIYNLVEKVLSETENKSERFPGHEKRLAGHEEGAKAHYRNVMDNPGDFSEAEVTHAKSFFRGQNKDSGRKGGLTPKTKRK